MSERNGLTLKAALEQFTDADIRHAHQECLRLLQARQPYHRALRAAAVEPFPAWLGAEGNSRGRANRLKKNVGHASGETALKAQLKQIERHRKKNLTDKLLSGDLVAMGIECPRRLDSERRKIPENLFRVLKLDFRRSRLHGTGIEIVEVRVYRPDNGETVVEDETARQRGHAVARRAVVETADDLEIKVPDRGRPGRLGLPPDFALEMRRRADAGQMLPSLNREADYLQKWGVHQGFQNPQGRPWAKSTIKNNLRALYRELKARNRDPK